jgi:hypothetical protein
MKTTTSLLLGSMILVLCVSSFATVRTVSSNPSTIGQYSNIQAAIDDSADGDSIYVYGSPNTYPAFTISDKKITVIGPGWAPDKNLPLTAIVNGMVIRNTAASGVPDGSEIQGLVMVGHVSISQAGGTNSSVNNIRLIRCQFNSSMSFDLTTSDVLIEGCVFYHSISFSGSLTYTSFLFQNNFFFHQICCIGNMITGLTNTVNVRFDHNLFFSSNNGGGSNAFIFGANTRFLSFSNNIFNQTNVGNDVSFSNYNNNITNNALLNTANATSNATPWAVNSNVNVGGNVSNTSPQMVDQTQINAGNSSQLLNFTIAAGPANNSGSDGKDMGLLFDTVGALNWTNSRNARTPRIYTMNITTPTVPQGGSLSVTVEARKSN